MPKLPKINDVNPFIKDLEPGLRIIKHRQQIMRRAKVRI